MSGKKGYFLGMDSQTWEPMVFDGYYDISKAIGGSIECVPVHELATVYCHEEGKIRNLTPTALWFDPEEGTILDVICGPVVLLGTEDDEGDDTDLDEVDFLEVTQHLPIIALDKRHLVPVPEPRMTILTFDTPEELFEALSRKKR